MARTLRKLGLIGGLSWVSTADYYRRLNELTQARAGGVSSARIVLESVDRQAYVEAVIERSDEAAACRQILAAAEGLERAGAEIIVITCNDVHRFVPEIAPRIGLPFLHIAEVTAAAIAAAGLSRVAVLGVRKTMEGDFYPATLARHGIGVVSLTEDEKAYVHDTIYDELTQNLFREETRRGYRELIAGLAARGAEGVALACTEIPLLIGPQDVPLPTFSTTELHVDAAVAWALGSEQATTPA